MLIILLTTIISSNLFAVTNEATMKILKKARCLTCHSAKKDKIGPSFNSIAERYSKPNKKVLAYLKGKSAQEYLFGKVRKGTKKKNRNWVKSKKGRKFGIMTANKPHKISDENLNLVLEDILAGKIKK